MQITSKHSQSMLDIALQHTGDVSNVFTIAFKSNISVSAYLEAQTVLEVPAATNLRIVHVLASELIPATGLNAVLQGISIDEIGNFIIPN